MAHGYNTTLPHLKRYPGEGYYYIICDVCGRKIRRKDAIYIRNRYNLQNRLLVCPKDADKENPQARPFKAREYKAPKLVRTEPSDDYLTNTFYAPSAPVQLKASGSPISDNIVLSWLGPDDTGSSPITGYIIYRAIPQLGENLVLNANTGSNATFYEDLTTPVGTFCTYQIAAINAAGISPLSAVAYYPYENVSTNVIYITTNQGPTIVTNQGPSWVYSYGQ